MMGTSAVGCGKRTVRGLLQNCALASEDWVGASMCEDGTTNTCKMANDMITAMLQQTLGTWGKNYQFFIKGTDAVEKILIEQGTCEGEREGSTRPEKIKPGLDIVLTLYICQ
jgi:hypothetical protein